MCMVLMYNVHTFSAFMLSDVTELKKWLETLCPARLNRAHHFKCCFLFLFLFHKLKNTHAHFHISAAVFIVLFKEWKICLYMDVILMVRASIKIRTILEKWYIKLKKKEKKKVWKLSSRWYAF